MKTNKLISYCLLSYNQEEFIEEAIQGALDQTYSNLEIIISDDASTDLTFEIIKSVVEGYRGSHKIILNQNERNLGIGAHFSKVCKTIAKGDYIITAAGDDISKLEHVKIAAKLMDSENVVMIDFNGEIIDNKTSIIGQRDLNYYKKKFTIKDYLKFNTIQSFAPGRIIKKELFQKFNLISSNCPTEDSVTVLRSLLLGGFLRVNEALVLYRKHDSNTSNINNLSKMSNMRIIAQYFEDVLHLYDNNFISDKKCSLLLDRIHLELEIRNKKYEINHNYFSSMLSSFWLRIRIHLLKNKIKG